MSIPPTTIVTEASKHLRDDRIPTWACQWPRAYILKGIV